MRVPAHNRPERMAEGGALRCSRWLGRQRTNESAATSWAPPLSHPPHTPHHSHHSPRHTSLTLPRQLLSTPLPAPVPYLDHGTLVVFCRRHCDAHCERGKCRRSCRRRRCRRGSARLVLCAHGYLPGLRAATTRGLFSGLAPYTQRGRVVVSPVGVHGQRQRGLQRPHSRCNSPRVSRGRHGVHLERPERTSRSHDHCRCIVDRRLDAAVSSARRLVLS